MPATMEQIMAGAFSLQCNACQRSGTKAWADDHARETGHSVFTVLAT
jgi:hypothetical protein